MHSDQPTAPPHVGSPRSWALSPCYSPLRPRATPKNPIPTTTRAQAKSAPGQPEAGSEEQQVQYEFFCNGPITGYELQAQIPLTGTEASPLVTGVQAGNALTDTFSCSAEFPGYATNCVGLTHAGYERITGQFAIGTKICVEPRVDPLLTVTYAYLEKGVITQAISGPFDLGRPAGCPADAFSGSTRLNPKPPVIIHKKKHKKKAHAKKASHAKKAAHKNAGPTK